MRLPPDNSEFMAFVRYGRYATRRLRRAGLTSLSQDAEKVTLDVKTAGRLWEDADEPIQDAMADRDTADDGLDLAAQQLRATLASRGLGADKRAPYTQIFHQGISFYTAAPLDQEEARYGELRLRVEEHLPVDDAARQQVVASIDAGLKAFRQAVDELHAAEAREALAGTRVRSAIATFSRQMEKTFGALVIELGKAEAERFFPKVRGGKGSSGGGGAPFTPTPTTPSGDS
jgi:restriction endonuclease Mrr